MGWLKFSNQGGFPCLEANSITSDGTNTTVYFNKHNYFNNRFYGGIYVKIPMAVTTSTEPLFFATTGVSGSSIPVYLNTGAQATVANIVTTGNSVYQLFYDRDNNKLQLI